jgi:hypothetical protein
MAKLPHTRSAMAETDGKQLHDHKLVNDSHVGFRNSDRHPSSDSTEQGSTYHPGGRGSGQSTSEEAAEEDDDEDSSGNQDDAEDEEEDPEVLAPSHGGGLGKGKRPAIRVDHVDEDEPHDDEEEAVFHETGLRAGKNPAIHGLRKTKRTFSNVSNTSILFGEDDAEHRAFPRSKMARTLSSNNLKPLLTYKNNGDVNDSNSFENAIESSDEEHGVDIDDEDYSGVNLISDDSDVEQQDEDYLIDQERHIAFDIVTNPRRYSLESAASDDFFNLGGTISESFFNSTTFPDPGFGQFFEPAPSPVPVEPQPKRKYSTASSKRVRFDDDVKVSDSSSSSTSELDSALWPDLFMEQEKLPPSIYQLIENDNETDQVDDFPSSESERSFYDYGQVESYGQALPVEEDFDDESSDPGSSGYESRLDRRMAVVH